MCISLSILNRLGTIEESKFCRRRWHLTEDVMLRVE
jgi:hypothetical protein